MLRLRARSCPDPFELLHGELERELSILEHIGGNPSHLTTVREARLLLKSALVASPTHHVTQGYSLRKGPLTLDPD